MPSVFIDTNILMYAHDSKEPLKNSLAQKRIRELIASHTPIFISAQVLQELYVNLVRKRVTAEDARQIVSAYAGWQVIANDGPLVLAGMGLCDRFQISLWDSLIIAAALRAGATEVWSEDLNDGQNYGGVTVINPLK